MRRVRLAIVSTHPIQYYAPVFRALASSPLVQPRVFYTWSQTEGGVHEDVQFGRKIAWDVPLLGGYEHEFVPNVSERPSSDHFKGIVNPGLVPAIEAWGADAVLVYAWNLSSHLTAMRHFKNRVPVFFRGDSTLIDPQPSLRTIARRLWLRWVYRHVDVAISVGTNNQDYFRWCGLPTERIAYAPHSVDTARFADADGQLTALASRWREQMEIPANAPVLVFAAKFIPKKDPLLLLQAFRSSGVGELDAHLVLVGNGELEAQMKAWAADDPHIHFMPFQNQSTMPAVYRLGDVFVLPSRGPGETWGLALNEAMASGRAVIASSRVGGARDLVIPGENGWTFEAGDGGDLARVLRAAMTTRRVELRRLGENARRRIDEWSTAAAASGIAEAVARFTLHSPRLLSYVRHTPRA